MKYALPFLLLAAPALADAPEIDAVTASRGGEGWQFSVTLSHPDTGWDHYADGWQVELADGTVLGTRVLAHPHVQEQPFTRSLSGVVIPDGIDMVYLRARCSVDGWNPGTTVFELPR